MKHSAVLMIGSALLGERGGRGKFEHILEYFELV